MDHHASLSKVATGRDRDVITGQALQDALVLEARQKGVDYVAAKGVWRKRPKEEARRRTGRPPISVRWVDVNKGDDLCPKYRSSYSSRPRTDPASHSSPRRPRSRR